MIDALQYAFSSARFRKGSLAQSSARWRGSRALPRPCSAVGPSSGAYREFKNERRCVRRAEFDIGYDVSVEVPAGGLISPKVIVLETRGLATFWAIVHSFWDLSIIPSIGLFRATHFLRPWSFGRPL